MPLSLSEAQRQPLGGPFNFFLILCKFVYMHVYFFVYVSVLLSQLVHSGQRTTFKGWPLPPAC